jgi:hypothetical protein
MFVRILDAKILTMGCGCLKKCCKLSMSPGKVHRYFDTSSFVVDALAKAERHCTMHKSDTFWRPEVTA